MGLSGAFGDSYDPAIDADVVFAVVDPAFRRTEATKDKPVEEPDANTNDE